MDATAVARTALRHPELPEATLAGIERQIGLLVAHREMLVNERTDRICKLRWLLHDLDPELAPREITVRANELERRIDALVRAHAPALLAIPGCGVLTAAKIVAEVAQVSRFPTEGHFARYAGTAPIPASSGNRHRQRFNRRGNRQLNTAIDRIGVTQLRIHEPAKHYVTRKRAEGKTKTEAIRALKRHIARVVFKTMTSMDQPTDRLTAVAA